MENELLEPSEAMHDEEALAPWSEWIQRTTHKIEEMTETINIQSWVVNARCAKWRLAGKIVHRSPDHWADKLLFGDPEFYFDGTSKLQSIF